MLMFHLVLTASAMAATTSVHAEVLEPPAQMKATLSTALTEINFLGQCTSVQTNHKLDDEFEKKDATYFNAEREARNIWGGTVKPDHNSDANRSRACSKHNIAHALHAVERALTSQRSIFNEAIKVMAKGMWVGPMKLCQGNVKRAVLENDQYTNTPTLYIELDPTASATLSEITGRAVNEQLAIRSNGEVILRPTIYEPMGNLAINGPEYTQLRAMKDELSKVC